MDELNSATVQEADPVSLSASTASPAPVVDAPPSSTSSSRPMSPHSTSGNDTSASVSDQHSSESHDHGPAERPTTSHSGQSLAAKKPSVSSGISRRIEALKMMSNNAGGPGAGNHLSPHTHSNVAAFERMRKRTSDNITARTTSGASRPTSPTSDFLANQRRLSSLPAEKLRGGQPFKPQRLTLDSRTVTSPLTSPIDSFMLPESRPLSRSNTYHEPPAMVRTPSTASMSMKSRQFDPTTNGTRRPGTASPATTNTSNSLDGDVAPSGISQGERPQSPGSYQREDENRTANLMRRMTSAGNNVTLHHRRGSVASIVSNFNLPSPTRTEQEPYPVIKPEIPKQESKPKPALAIDIGEVNVHFPDTLLWKRRNMRIDEEGYLLLIAPITGGYKPPVRKYHISKFKTPRVPELDEEELPHSVVLDFIEDGDTLQCACQSRQGQEEVHKSTFAHCFSLL